MTDLLILYWPAIVGVALIVLALVMWAAAGRRRRVDIARPTLDDAPPTPTLARARSETVPPPPAPSPVASPPVAVASELGQLKGVGPKLVALLATHGITRIDQVAGWTAADLADIDAKLGTFAGRATRDRWVDQAQLLAAGDVAAYEASFGKLDGSAA